MRFPGFTFTLPGWIEHHLPDPDHTYPAVEDRVELAIELSRLNIKHGTGGPFGAAVFNLHTKKLLSPGVNIVVPANCSSAHAEVTAITIAQQIAGQYDLGSEGLPPYELAVSAEPCVMCFGSIIWSGIRHLAFGARASDVCAIGFDEGPKPLEWKKELEDRGLTVIPEVCRKTASAVLQQYHKNGGAIYNSRKGTI